MEEQIIEPSSCSIDWMNNRSQVKFPLSEHLGLSIPKERFTQKARSGSCAIFSHDPERLVLVRSWLVSANIPTGHYHV